MVAVDVVAESSGGDGDEEEEEEEEEAEEEGWGRVGLALGGLISANSLTIRERMDFFFRWNRKLRTCEETTREWK